MPARAALTAAAACLALAACGAPQPQAPSHQADRLAAALSGIAQACGRAYQDGPRPALQDTASRRVDELLSVYRRDPRWIFKGQTVAATATLAAARLRACGLTRAAARLITGTRSPRRPSPRTPAG